MGQWPSEFSFLFFGKQFSIFISNNPLRYLGPVKHTNNSTGPSPIDEPHKSDIAWPSHSFDSELSAAEEFSATATATATITATAATLSESNYSTRTTVNSLSPLLSNSPSAAGLFAALVEDQKNPLIQRKKLALRHRGFVTGGASISVSLLRSAPVKLPTVSLSSSDSEE
ncbi:hypothetical protein Ancab_009003 [Ancistrocladus abbreviatus]